MAADPIESHLYMSNNYQELIDQRPANKSKARSAMNRLETAV